MGSAAGWINKGQSKAASVIRLRWDKTHDKFKTGGAPPGESFDAGVRWIIEKKGDEIPQFRSVEKRNPKGGAHPDS